MPPFKTGVQQGGDCNRWVNYVSVVRAESHYPPAVLWFSTGFLYLNPKLTFLNRFKKPPSVNSQTHETHVFAHVSFLDPGPARLTSASAGQGHPNGKTHILTYVALLVREIYFVFYYLIWHTTSPLLRILHAPKSEFREFVSSPKGAFWAVSKT